MDPQTPTKAYDNVSNIIRKLSAKWDLGLPIRETPWSPSRIEDPQSPQERIFSHIRYLNFKDPTALNQVIASFEEYAGPKRSEWKWKPRQEAGTLPTSTVGGSAWPRESFLKTREVWKSATLDLLQYLLKLLDDEVYIVRARDEGTRTPLTGEPHQQGNFSGDVPPEKPKRPRAKSVVSPSKAKPAISPGKAKRQTTLDYLKTVPQDKSGRGLSMATVV